MRKFLNSFGNTVLKTIKNASVFILGKWPEFFAMDKFSKPYKREAKDRIKENLSIFMLNYIVIDFIFAITYGRNQINDVLA